MSTATAALHAPSELTFIGADDRTGIVVFQAASAHDPNRVNTVALDTMTGDIICDCTGAEFGRRCWHIDHVVAAWQQTPAMHAARCLTETALLNQGRKAAAMVATYRERVGRPLADDVITLVAARSEWRRRAARAAVEAAYAVVTEWDRMGQGDRAIDAGRGGLTAYHAAKDVLLAHRAA
jgi:hypothetical protein